VGRYQTAAGRIADSHHTQQATAAWPEAQAKPGRPAVVGFDEKGYLYGHHFRGGMMAKRFVRSRDDKMICGVAAGIGRYFDVDPTFVRLAWVVAILLPGPNLILILAYLLLCIIMPLESTGDRQA
jgi:phage shock protein C